MHTTPDTTPFDLKGKRVWVAGHRGLVGSALARRLARENCQILTVSRGEVDLKSADRLDAWMRRVRPEVILMAAAKVGGIYANDTRPAEFIYENLMIEANVIEAARRYEVKKLVFLGSSCIYPRLAPQPIPEDALLTGPLEPTNQWYAIAKIAGIKLCQAYRRQYGMDAISIMPTNLYGPGDNFDLMSSHVAPALMAKAHEAKLKGADHLQVWGTGRALRELLYVDDAADGIVFLTKNYSGEEIVNLGTGEEVTVAELADTIRRVVGFKGEIRYDTSKPDGTPRKVVDVSHLAQLGWRARVSLEDGLKQTYCWYLENKAEARKRALAHA